MTTPTERTRNLVQAGTFLKEIRSDESLPARLRDEAHRLLRHYLTWDEIQMLAGHSSMLTNEFVQISGGLEQQDRKQLISRFSTSSAGGSEPSHRQPGSAPGAACSAK